MEFDPNDILISVIFILLHFLLALTSYKIVGKRILHPAVLYSGLWFIIVLLHLLFRFTILDELPALHLITHIVLFIGSVSFNLGGFIVQYFTIYRNNKHTVSIVAKQPEEFKFSFSMAAGSLILVLVGLPFYIRETYRVFIASQIDDFFLGVRTALIYYDEDIGPTKYLLSFSFIVFGILLCSFLQKRTTIYRIMLWVSLLAALTYAVLATGRTSYLTILMLYVGIDYFFNKKFVVKKYIWLAVAFLTLFMAAGFLVGKGGNLEDSAKDNLESSSQLTATYLVLSLNALDYENTHHHEINNKGDNTLRFFVKVGRTLGILENRQEAESIKEFQFLPYPTNVYTVYSNYINDFGKLYAWLMIALFGALHTWVHNKAISTRSFRWVLYYSFLLYPLLMSFFHDQYMGLFSMWLQIVVFVELLLAANAFFIRKKWQ